MDKFQNDVYRKGYITGYRDGLRDAAAGKTLEVAVSNIGNLPIQAMGLSTRARNCLSNAGCVYVADVAKLSNKVIAVMRNMGPKTASEIAHWLDKHGMCLTAWADYL